MKIQCYACYILVSRCKPLLKKLEDCLFLPTSPFVLNPILVPQINRLLKHIFRQNVIIVIYVIQSCTNFYGFYKPNSEVLILLSGFIFGSETSKVYDKIDSDVKL